MTTPLRDGAEFLVNTTTTGYQIDPTITALADGRFVVAWTDISQSGDDSSGDAVRAQIFTAEGRKQGDEFLVNTTTIQSQYNPTITGLVDGRFVVAWTDTSRSGGDTSRHAVRAQLFLADGRKQGAEFLVNTTTKNFQYAPRITALADGRFVVAWMDESGSGADTPGSDVDVRAQIFTADGQKQGDEFLVNTTTTGWQIDPTITALADGRFVVVWTDESESGNDTSGAAVRAQLFTADGQKQGDEFLVNTTTTGLQNYPTITALTDGRFVVAWTDNSQSGNDTSVEAVRAQIFAANGQKQGDEFLVNTTTTSDQVSPSITALADGLFVVAWTDNSQSGNDPSGYAVRAQQFGSDGRKLGEEFLVNTTTSSDQYQPTITTLADGRFVLAWNDESKSGGDTSSTAVRAQIFDGRSAAIQLDGTPAHDDFVGTAFGDRISGLSGNDRLRGRGGNDRLRGDSGNDQLLGEDGNDLLDGGQGRDTLTGGNGRDTLTGGEGADLFRYSTAAEAGLHARRDVITDFSSGSDRLDLRSIDADTTRARNQSFVFIGELAFSAAGQIHYEKSTGLLSADTNGDRIADFQLQLSNTPTLLATDILL